MKNKTKQQMEEEEKKKKKEEKTNSKVKKLHRKCKKELQLAYYL